MGATQEQMDQRLAEMWKFSLEHNLDLRLYLSMCFYDVFEKREMPVNEVADLMQKAHEMGIQRLVISDTTGHGTPERARAIIEEAVKRGIPISHIEGHCHDTYGTGLSTSLAMIEMGVRTIDSSAGGIGGCPYAPGATGNLATEDLVWALERQGIRTGISLEKLMEATTFLFENCFPDQKPTSRVYNALMSKPLEERQEILRQLQPYLYEKEAEQPRTETKPLDFSTPHTTKEKQSGIHD